jgi:uncharacterized membrane protein (DUF485 family)
MKVVLLSFSRLALLKNTKFTYLTFSTFKEKKNVFYIILCIIILRLYLSIEIL